MKKYFVLILCAAVAACSSPVEEYIINEFANTVREDDLQEEIKTEVDRWSSLLNDMAVEANPVAKEAKELESKAKRMEQEIETRLRNYERTGDYSYIINIYGDGEKCEAMYNKADQLSRKARPYEKHKTAQIKEFSGAINGLDGLAIFHSSASSKDDAVTEQYVFEHLVGTPENMAKPSEAEVDTMATKVLANYFSTHPTPTVKVHKYLKDKKCWNIYLTDGSHYYLNAIKCDNGEYEYEYSEADEGVSAPTASLGKKKRKSGNMDDFLDEYEKFVNGYIKSYKKLYKRSVEGDLSVLAELQKLSIKAAEFVERYDSFDADPTPKQLMRYNEITAKLAMALEEISND